VSLRKEIQNPYLPNILYPLIMNENDEDVPSLKPQEPQGAPYYQQPPSKQPPSQPPPAQIPVYSPENDARVQKEVEEIKRKISRFFSIYDVRISVDAVAFYLRVNEDTLEDNFENVRNILKPDYIPMLSYEGGEHIMFVMKKPKAKYKGINVNIALLIITLITTTISGSLLWTSYDAAIQEIAVSDINGMDIFSPVNLLFGAIFFSLPLLLILGTHETGHYLMAKKHGVAASLPFFIPMIPPLGTLGALISMREPIPNKKALIDIGAAGPIAGFLVAIPVTILGFVLTSAYNAPVQPNEPGGLILFNPLILMGLSNVIPIGPDVLAHPTFFAGWVGILVTALNLLPAGQLDGGHIIRALVGDKTRYIGISTVIIMFFLGFAFNYFGYVFLIVIVMVLGGGLGHPPPLNDVTKLDRKRIGVGMVAVLIFVVSFHPAPIQQAMLPDYGFNLSSELSEAEVIPGGFVEFNITVINSGNIENDAFLNLSMNQTKVDEGWNATLQWIGNENQEIYNVTDASPLTFNVNEKENVTVKVSVPSTATIGENITLTITLKWNSWEYNELQEVEKRVRGKAESVKIRVK
jgi:Zn-dependent protease